MFRITIFKIEIMTMATFCFNFPTTNNTKFVVRIHVFYITPSIFLCSFFRWKFRTHTFFVAVWQFMLCMLTLSFNEVNWLWMKLKCVCVCFNKVDISFFVFAGKVSVCVFVLAGKVSVGLCVFAGQLVWARCNLIGCS